MISVTTNGKVCEVEEGRTLLSAVTDHGVYVPTLCHHPDLPPFHDLTPVLKVFRGEQVYEHQPVAEDFLRELEGCGLCVDVAAPLWADAVGLSRVTCRQGRRVETGASRAHWSGQ